MSVEPSLPAGTSAGTGTASPTAVTSEGYWNYSNTANPAAQIGRLFFKVYNPSTQAWYDSWCSATVVNSENKSLVWTAGHCVYDTYWNRWNNYYTFCPGYRNGSCPLGQWKAALQNTTAEWKNARCQSDGRCSPTEFWYDLGVLKMKPLNNALIANRIGSHGIAFSGATVQTRYLFGYPKNKSNGQALYYCYGSNTVNASSNLTMAPCSAGGGASGGPWLSQINGSWLGMVHSVNSHGGEGDMNGPYQGTVAANLYNGMRR